MRLRRRKSEESDAPVAARDDLPEDPSHPAQLPADQSPPGQFPPDQFPQDPYPAAPTYGPPPVADQPYPDLAPQDTQVFETAPAAGVSPRGNAPQATEITSVAVAILPGVPLPEWATPAPGGAALMDEPPLAGAPATAPPVDDPSATGYTPNPPAGQPPAAFDAGAPYVEPGFTAVPPGTPLPPPDPAQWSEQPLGPVVWGATGPAEPQYSSSTDAHPQPQDWAGESAPTPPEAGPESSVAEAPGTPLAPPATMAPPSPASEGATPSPSAEAAAPPPPPPSSAEPVTPGPPPAANAPANLAAQPQFGWLVEPDNTEGSPPTSEARADPVGPPPVGPAVSLDEPQSAARPLADQPGFIDQSRSVEQSTSIDQPSAGDQPQSLDQPGGDQPQSVAEPRRVVRPDTPPWFNPDDVVEIPPVTSAETTAVMPSFRPEDEGGATLASDTEPEGGAEPPPVPPPDQPEPHLTTAPSEAEEPAPTGFAVPAEPPAPPPPTPAVEESPADQAPTEQAEQLLADQAPPEPFAPPPPNAGVEDSLADRAQAEDAEQLLADQAPRAEGEESTTPAAARTEAEEPATTPDVIADIDDSVAPPPLIAASAPLITEHPAGEMGDAEATEGTDAGTEATQAPEAATSDTPPPSSESDQDTEPEPRRGRALRWILIIGGVVIVAALAGYAALVNPGFLSSSSAPPTQASIDTPASVAGMTKSAKPAQPATGVFEDTAAALGAAPGSEYATYTSGKDLTVTVWVSPTASANPAEIARAYTGAGGEKLGPLTTVPAGPRGGSMACAAVSAEQSLCFWTGDGVSGAADVTGLGRSAAAGLVAKMRLSLEPPTFAP